MRLPRPQDVASVELVNALKGDGAAFLLAQQLADLFPGPPALSLLANEIHERFQPTVVGATAAAFGPVSCCVVIHGIHCFSTTAYAKTSGTRQKIVGGLSPIKQNCDLEGR